MLSIDQAACKLFNSCVVHSKTFHNAKLPTKGFAFAIDLLAILRKSLDRATFLYIFIREVRLNGVRASIAIVHIRKFYEI